jgi:colanic acid/amylovoran biosynthesis glycosyltransferase
MLRPTESADRQDTDQRADTTPQPSSPIPGQHRVAYIMSRFPNLTETFVLFEMLAIENKGVQVEVFPLLRARNTGTHPEGAGLWTKFKELFRRPADAAVMHPEARAFVARAHFVPFLNLPIASSQVRFLLRHPITYFSVLWTLIRANWGSANFLLGALVVFPKCVYFAHRMQQLGIEHIHAHFANHPAAAAYIVSRLSGIPYSFTGHGADLQVDQHMLSEKIAAATHVVAISEDNRRFIRSVCGPEAADRVSIIHCGVDTSVFDGSSRQNTNASRAFQIISVGTLYEVKGHTYLIEACRLLAERNAPFHCQLVGDGPMRDELEQQSRTAGISDKIDFLGRQTRAQIAQLLKSADVLVAPSVPATDGRRGIYR